MKNEKRFHFKNLTKGPFRAYIFLLLIGFLVGFIPMWRQARQASEQLSMAMSRMHLVQLQVALGTAAIDAQQGKYESARLAISGFFSSLRMEIARKDHSALTMKQSESLGLLFSKRDEIVTLLARGDTASGEQMVGLYSAFMAVVGKQPQDLSPSS